MEKNCKKFSEKLHILLKGPKCLSCCSPLLLLVSLSVILCFTLFFSLFLSLSLFFLSLYLFLSPLLLCLSLFFSHFICFSLYFTIFPCFSFSSPTFLPSSVFLSPPTSPSHFPSHLPSLPPLFLILLMHPSRNENKTKQTPPKKV